MIKEEAKDALGELINIAFGSATAIIADLFDKFATLHIPHITMKPLRDIEEFVLEGLANKEIYITTQQFKGNFEGEIIFVIDKISAQNMQKMICATEGLGVVEVMEDTEIQHSILEISNILGSCCVGKLAELLDTDVTFAPPGIELRQKLIGTLDETGYDHILIISTIMEFEETQILGKLFIMFSDEMFSWLEKTLQNYMENM